MSDITYVGCLWVDYLYIIERSQFKCQHDCNIVMEMLDLKPIIDYFFLSWPPQPIYTNE